MVFPIILLSAAVLLLLILYLIYRKAFFSPHKNQDNIRAIPRNAQYAPYRETMLALIYDLAGRPFEEVTILSHDGLHLFGRYYHYADGAPLDIAFHGYRGTAVRDMCGGIRISYLTGHNILLVDQRAHGRSEGHTITFGILERRDCAAWVDYARARFGEDLPILLYGVSMGATTVLMASALALEGKVCAIVADCPFSSPCDIIRKVCRDMHLPPRLTFPFIRLSARVFGRFCLTETTAADAVRASSIPTLILHGEDDRYVPQEMSAVIAQARPDILYHTFPNAGHGISGIVHTQRYNEIVMNFINAHCKRNPT